MHRSTLFVCALALACNKPSDAPSKASEIAVESPAPVEPAVPVAPVDERVDEIEPKVLTPSALLIGNDDVGLVEYDLDGKRLATLAPGPASSPRVLADGRVVFLRDDPQLELWMHTPGGETKRIAALPQRWKGETCKAEFGVPGEDESLLAVQAPGDFRLDPAKQEACIRLQDSNDNMANFGVAVWVSLVDGTIRQAPTLDEEGECAPGEVASYCFELALESPSEPAPPGVFAYTYEPTTGSLSGPADSKVSICGGEGEAGESECATVEQRSASGRFELLSGQMDSGDYIYTEVFVLDRESGKLWAIASGDDPRVFEIKPADVYAGLHSDWLAIPGESDVRWLAKDRLWIDGLLIDPSTQTLTRVGNDLAFRLDRRG